MFVLCPHCQFLVALDPVTGEPPPRCPRCNGAVQPAVAQPSPSAAVPEDATTALPTPGMHDLPSLAPSPEAEIATPRHDDIGNVDAVHDIDDDAVATGPSADATAESTDATIVEPAPDAEPGISTPPRKHAPSFVGGERTLSTGPGAPRRWWIPASLVGLTLLLSLQIVLADRARLAADARWRPALQHVCAMLRCSLPPWREVDAITLLDRDVRPDREA